MVRQPNMHLTVGPTPCGEPAWGCVWLDTVNHTLNLYNPDTDTFLNLLEYIISAAPYAGDETEKSVVGIASTKVKEHRFSLHGRTKSIMIHVELKTTTGTTGFLEIYIDGALKLTLSTTKTDYEVLMGTIDTQEYAAATDGSLPGPSAVYVHLVEVKLRNSNAGGTTTTRLYDFFYAA